MIVAAPTLISLAFPVRGIAEQFTTLYNFSHRLDGLAKSYAGSQKVLFINEIGRIRLSLNIYY